MKCISCHKEFELIGIFGQCPECSLRTLELNKHRNSYNMWSLSIMPENTMPTGSVNFSQLFETKIKSIIQNADGLNQPNDQ